MGTRTTITRVLLAVASLGAAASIANAAGSRDDGGPHAIVVTERSGAVAITANGDSHDAGAGSRLALPSRIATGADGFLALAQDETRISIAPQSDVEIPADAAEGHLVARLVQRSGNVFYDVQKREAGRLRVETPFLVAVIKGTQFNVAVQPDSTTISLFEGRLEVRTPDGGEVIQLDAGEIAIRSRIDDSIRVIGMNDQALAAPPGDDAGRVATARDAVASLAGLTTGTAEIDSAAALDMHAGTATLSSVEVKTTSDLRVTAFSADTVGSTAGGVAAHIGATADIGLDAASLSASLDTSADLSGATVDLAADTHLDLGDAGVQLGADTGIDVGGSGAVLDTSLDAGIDLGGGATLDSNLVAGADLSGSGLVLDTSLDAGIDVGGSTIDAAVETGLDTGVDLGGTATELDASLDTGIDVAASGLDTSLDTSVDLGTGTVDTSVDLGDTSVDLGIAPDTGLDVGLDADLFDDGGGLLGGSSNDSGASDGGSGGLLGGLL